MVTNDVDVSDQRRSTGTVLLRGVLDLYTVLRTAPILLIGGRWVIGKRPGATRQDTIVLAQGLRWIATLDSCRATEVQVVSGT